MRHKPLHLLIACCILLLGIVACGADSEQSAQEAAPSPIAQEQEKESEPIAQSTKPVKPTETSAPSPIPPTNTPKPDPTAKPLLPILEPAPNITNEVWLNSEPTTLENQRGKVVLLEFWTFG